MASIPPNQNFAFPPHRYSLQPQVSAEASSSKQVVDLLATSDEKNASVDVNYSIVWTAGEPPPPFPQRQRSPLSWTAVDSPSSWSQTPSLDGIAALFPSIWSSRPSGAVLITGSAAKDNVRSRSRSRYDAPSVPTPHPISEGKIPCIATLHRGTLGALSTCLYDRATDSFSNFSADNGDWAHQKDYHDHGAIQLSTRKWSQGSWVSVEDDNGHDFLFVTVERDHGLVRVWRPNMVAKRDIGTEKTELTYEEVMRLGLNEDDSF